MKKFLLFGAGAAAGYVLGAKAGTRRYEQISATASSLAAKAGLTPTRRTPAWTETVTTTGFDEALVDPEHNHPGPIGSDTAGTGLR